MVCATLLLHLKENRPIVRKAQQRAEVIRYKAHLLPENFYILLITLEKSRQAVEVRGSCRALEAGAHRERNKSSMRSPPHAMMQGHGSLHDLWLSQGIPCGRVQEVLKSSVE